MRTKLVIAGGHAAKLLEAAEKPLHGVTLGIASRSVGPRVAALAPGRNGGLGAPGGQSRHERVGIVAAVGNQVGRGPLAQQRQGLRRIVALAGTQAQPHGPAAGIGHDVQLRRQTAAAAAQGLRPVFLRAPDACWCARTVVESTSSVCNALSSYTATSTRAHTPAAVQRCKRVYVVYQLLYSVGKARHRHPLRSSHSTASTNRRLSCPRLPFVPSRPGSNGEIRPHCTAVNK